MQALQALQAGGSSSEVQSTEGQILGATVIALLTGGALKATIDFLMPQ